ncbi:hypothetical protein TWF481_007617 [Arthrobotrys musiformis]|uniref:F-box domain-containing protein n=1 Tax=Arthrobotrys musiformis TaxID=47236 RepID=A0AAV9WC15_9PEZI
MAPINITAFARAPEILFEIISYLPGRDTLNFGLTCKAIFPVCYRALWSNLSLFQVSGANSWPGLRIKSKYLSEFSKTVEEYWTGSPGLKYTKRIDLGRVIYDDGPEAPVLMDLLEGGRINPSRMDLFLQLPGYRSLPRGDPNLIFERFKKYTESKSLRELKLQVYSEIGNWISEMIDVTKVTKLTLYISSNGYREVAEPSEVVSSRIKDVTALLENSTNLRYLYWKGAADRRYLFSSVSEDLKGLQAAITNLKRLKALKIENHFFHPSFFVVPPEGVRNLVLNCRSSAKWWQDFAACPLTNVRDLRFHRIRVGGELDIRRFVSDEEDVPLTTIKLGKVAVQGLEKCLCRWWDVPQDLFYCMLRGNPKLGPEDKFELAERIAKLSIKQFHTRFEVNWFQSKGFIQDLYIKRHLNNSEPTTELEIMEEYSKKAILGEIEKGSVLAWDRAQKRANDLALKYKPNLEEKLHDSIDYAVHNYTLTFMESKEDIEVDEEEFKKECTRLFEEEAQMERKYSVAKGKAKEAVVPVVNRFRHFFDSLRKDTTRYMAVEIEKGLDVDEMSAMSYWVRKALAHFEDLGIAKLNLEDTSPPSTNDTSICDPV